MSTTSEALCGHFSRFGSVKDALIPKYRGVSAGLGIVSFNHPRDVEFVMAQSTHIIDSVQVEVGRLQWDRPVQDHATFIDQQQYSQVEESPRLFVSRLRESVTAEICWRHSSVSSAQSRKLECTALMVKGGRNMIIMMAALDHKVVSTKLLLQAAATVL
jgi:hypothetical protein